jgi:DNA polymerase III gamma/tau subunit
MFAHLLGNQKIQSYLSQGLAKNTLPHALLFSGISGVGKALFARALAASLLNVDPSKLENHPDFHWFKPESKSGLHTIDSLRVLIDEVHNGSFDRQGKVFVIDEADRMQTASANALLKTIEEPNPDTTLILISQRKNDVLPTIRSRCSCLAFMPLADEEVGTFLKSRNRSEKWAKFAQGSLEKALALSEKQPIEKELLELLGSRPIYPKLLIALEKLEAIIEDEDPVKQHQNGEFLFSAFLMWHRDQEARSLGLSSSHLFFPDEPKVSFPLPPIERVIKRLEEVRISYQRNIKISTCLESLFDLFRN